MLKLFLALLILLNISVLYGKDVEIQVLLINNTWLKADLLKADPKGNLIIRLKKAERILRRKEFRIVKMTPFPEVRKAEELLKQNKLREAEEILDTLAVKYNFPAIQAEIKVLLAQVKMAEAKPEAAVSILEPLLKDRMVMPEREALFYAHGFLLLANAYEQLKQQDNAVKAYRRSFDLAVPEYSATANLTLGKMFLRQKRAQAALDCFLENISVFSPGTPGHKLSLEETIAVYRMNKSKKLKLYEDMYKKDYPLKSK